MTKKSGLPVWLLVLLLVALGIVVYGGYKLLAVRVNGVDMPAGCTRDACIAAAQKTCHNNNAVGSCTSTTHCSFVCP